ncbi:unnamed protein product [Polarella glacialis]|uniref:Uncharacterized protein n=1 Tax=Polarella glacialis TaxID=89957 RepID=A0A813E2Z7_POLGL|nr:unnamed protein product [Polarella glacialis]
MGGFRQFTALLRKNVLLKSRRPCATFFEIGLPLVLFALLAYVRGVYEIKSYGPFFFEQGLLHPFGADLFGGEVSGTASRAAEEIYGIANASDSQEGFIGSTSADATSLTKTVEQALVCSDSNVDMLATNLEKVLGDELLGLVSLDPKKAESWTIDFLQSMQNWTNGSMSRQAEDLRTGYFDSEWPQVLTRAAKRAQTELQALSADLDIPGPDGALAARRRVEGWLGACNGSVYSANSSFGGSNRTWLAEQLKKLSNSMETSGMADWMREANMPDGSPSPMGYGLDSLTPTDISLAGIAAIVYLQEDENMKESMQYVDVTFMWMAHFLRSRSVTARMLGERASDISWWRVDSAAASTPPPKVLTDDGFQTEAARGMYMATESFRKEASPDDFGLEALTFEAWATELEDTASSGSSVNSSILDQLQSLADRLSRSSSDEIARDVLPGWEYNWSTPNCSASVSALGELAEKTHSRCPFYRSAVPEIATSTNLSNLVSRYYDYLYSVNFSLVESGLRELVPDPKSMGKAARKVVEGVQKRMAKTGNSSMRSEIASSLAIELQTAWSNERGLGSCRRRSEKPQPEGRRLSAASKFVQKELIRRKILVAPYKGEVKKLLDLAVVEAALGAWEDTTQGANTSQSTLAGFVGLLTRCPLIRGWTAQLGRYLLQDKMIMLDSVAEVEDYAKKLSDDVLLAVVFNSADGDGDFPPGALDIDYSIRVHAQLLPPTSRIVKMSRYATYGVKGMVSYPYLDLGFTYLQEVIGRAAARLEAIRQDVESSSKVGQNIAAGERTAPGRRLRVAVEQFPASRYAYDGFINVIQYTLPMFMILGPAQWCWVEQLALRDVVVGVVVAVVVVGVGVFVVVVVVVVV